MPCERTGSQFTKLVAVIVCHSLQMPAWTTCRTQVALPAAATQLAQGPQLPPKVALMFLPRGPMLLEPVWRAFLSAPGLAWPASQMRGYSADSSSSGSHDGSGSSSTAGSSGRPLFSLYVHCPPGFAYPVGSLFAGHEIAERVAVRWGQSTEVGEPQTAGCSCCLPGNMHGVAVMPC